MQTHTAPQGAAIPETYYHVDDAGVCIMHRDRRICEPTTWRKAQLQADRLQIRPSRWFWDGNVYAWRQIVSVFG